MPQITLIRHGESEWNFENRFTGWADVDITARGQEQIRFAAAQLLAAGVEFDIAFTSVLKRCIRSQWTLLDAMDRMWLPQVCDWRLNERHYGALTGMRTADAVAQFGEQTVYNWRRSYDIAPPPLMMDTIGGDLADRRYPGLHAEQRPRSESMHQTVQRISQVWHSSIAQSLNEGQRVLLVGHGNCLRGFIKLIEGISDADIAKIEMPNAAPIVYELDDDLNMIGKRCLSGPPQPPSEVL